MQIISAIMAVFALIGAVDRILNNRLGLGKEFEKGFMLYGQLAMAMIGMIVLSPVIANILRPAAMWVYEALHIDPSLITSLIVVNDMGGAALAQELAVDPLMGRFNGLVISCMMGATISFTIPYGLENVKPHQHNTLLLGMLCGVSTIPIGAAYLVLRTRRISEAYGDLIDMTRVAPGWPRMVLYFGPAPSALALCVLC